MKRDKTGSPKKTAIIAITAAEMIVIKAMMVNELNNSHDGAEIPLPYEVIKDDVASKLKAKRVNFDKIVTGLAEKQVIMVDGESVDKVICIRREALPSIDKALPAELDDKLKSTRNPAAVNKKPTVGKPSTSADKAKPDKAPKKENAVKAPSAYGTAVEIMATNPFMEFKALMKAVEKKLGAGNAKDTAVRTAHSSVKKIAQLLETNGWTAGKK